MHHSRHLPLFALVLLVLGFTAVSAALRSLPTSFIAEKAYASEGGSSGGSTGGTSGGGGSHNGGHRGHSTNVSRVVIRFLAQAHQIGMTEGQVPRWHPYSAPFVSNEKQFLCSLQRYFSRLEPSALNYLVLEELGRLMDRDETMIERFIKNPQSCK
jgi:hypothetical protein